ncbi:MAG: EEP domain-containing protein, partial [Polaromonas sp.]|nr:EEP domain-containing protein [Polaromonas sp.]
MPSSEKPLQPNETVAPSVSVVEAPPDEAEALAQTQQAIATAALSFSIKVLTVNIHKGFTFFNRKFILHELREAVRTVGADVVFLQEVTGTHARQESRVANYPATPH